MHITTLKIDKFRKFNNIELKLGKNITCLAGHNAVGKSTILGLLGHCGEYKKQDGVTLFGQQFRADLSEIIKFSNVFDLSGSNLFEIHFGDLPTISEEAQFPSSLSFRTTWQKNKTRYRILPIPKNDRNTEKKLEWPTFYLGLSRLYPIGESEDVDTINFHTKLNQNDKEFIFNTYETILTNRDKFTDITTLSLSDLKKKQSVGLNTNYYDYLTNSAGQDNLGQIIISVLSFKKLKESNPETWKGGLLLIDEIDATLHPAAQNKLFDFLLKQSKSLNLQIVFTTHSLSLLEHIQRKTKHNKVNTINKIELCYLTTANENLKVLSNPEINAIKFDLTNTYFNTIQSPKIPVYSEDAETRWFFKKIIEYAQDKDILSHGFKDKFKLIEIKIGCDVLLNLLSQDFSYFGECIMLFDGDVPEQDVQKRISKLPIQYSEQEYHNNKIIVKLPGDISPEALMWDYISTISEDNQFFMDPFTFDFGYSKRNLIENGPFSEHYKSYHHDREKFKKWFNDNLNLMEILMKFWLTDNEEMVFNFLDRLEPVYKFAATKHHLPTSYYFNKPNRANFTNEALSIVQS